MTAKEFILEEAKNNPALKGLETNLAQQQLLIRFAQFHVGEFSKEVSVITPMTHAKYYNKNNIK